MQSGQFVIEVVYMRYVVVCRVLGHSLPRDEQHRLAFETARLLLPMAPHERWNYYHHLKRTLHGGFDLETFEDAAYESGEPMLSWDEIEQIKRQKI